MVIHVRCAWCGKHLGAKEDNQPGNSEEAVSHSICPECRKSLLAEAGEYATHQSQKGEES